MSRRRQLRAAFVTASLLSAAPALAQNTLWGNSAQSTAPANIESFNKTTGVRTAQFAGAARGNGRGIVVVGNVVYYTMVGDPVIYRMDAFTGAPLGGITTSIASMSTIAWDGTAFWTSDYSGTNRAFRVSTTGTTLKTINLSLASTNMDGMEYFNGKLISNRSDGGSVYDIYDLDGNVLNPSFITTTGFSTGIAYDGTNFFVSRAFASSVDVFDGTTGAFITNRVLTPQSGRTIEDLSVDYNERLDTGPGPGTTVPEPSTWVLFGTGLLTIGGIAARRRRGTTA